MRAQVGHGGCRAALLSRGVGGEGEPAASRSRFCLERRVGPVGAGLALPEGAQGVTECTGPPGGTRELPPSRAARGPLPTRAGEERALEFLS